MKRRLLLVGGGHTHLAALAPLAAVWPGVVELVSPSERLLYSGMMPGWLAGQYTFDECVLPIAAWTKHSGAHWIEGRATDLRFAEHAVVLQDGRILQADLISVNLGSENAPGNAQAAAIPVLTAKPFESFVAQWSQCWPNLPVQPRILVVGAGPAAVELACALRTRTGAHAQVTLAYRGNQLLPGGANAWARALLARALARRNICCLPDHDYLAVRGNRVQFQVGGQSGAVGLAQHEADVLIFATGAQPPPWMTRCALRDGVRVAADGGLSIDDDLQASKTGWFAVGDCATFAHQAVPKSGLHALKQARILAHNLARDGQGQAAPLMYVPQSQSLVILNYCDGEALAMRGNWAAQGAWVWRWKDAIDRRFMARFSL